MKNSTIFYVGLLLLTYAWSSRAVPELITTTSGTIKGTLVNGTAVFLGIPFAQPPVGEYRFKSPLKVLPWTSVKEVTSYPPLCYQNRAAILPMSEDCLYLNLWTPISSTPSSKLPVMLWIHGGAFQNGGASFYSGYQLAIKFNVVVVAIQYRLGPLGFLSTPFLRSQNPELNFGLQDQRLAMEWVKSNALAFGGDPDNIVLFGESAGGLSVAFHLSSKLSWPYFSKAVLQSPGGNLLPLNQTYSFSNEVSSQLGCPPWETGDGSPQMDCLRRAPAANFVDKVWNDHLGGCPCVDELQTFEKTTLSMKKGSTRPNTPVLIGSNEAEGTLFSYTVMMTTNPEWWQVQLLEHMWIAPIYRYQPGVPVIESWYSKYWKNKSDWFEGATLMVGDSLLDCVALQMADQMSSNYRNQKGAGPVYKYKFKHITKNWMFSFLNATHAVEIPYVFSEPKILVMTFTPQEDALAHHMGEMWTHFARHGRPTPNPSNWPSYQDTFQGPTRELVSPPEHISFISKWKTQECINYMQYLNNP